jgi:hypothetical protein
VASLPKDVTAGPFVSDFGEIESFLGRFLRPAVFESLADPAKELYIFSADLSSGDGFFRRTVDLLIVSGVNSRE